MGRQTQTSFLPLHPVFAFQNAGWRNVNPDSVTFGGVFFFFFLKEKRSFCVSSENVLFLAQKRKEGLGKVNPTVEIRGAGEWGRGGWSKR